MSRAAKVMTLAELSDGMRAAAKISVKEERLGAYNKILPKLDFLDGNIDSLKRYCRVAVERYTERSPEGVAVCAKLWLMLRNALLKEGKLEEVLTLMMDKNAPALRLRRPEYEKLSLTSDLRACWDCAWKMKPLGSDRMLVAVDRLTEVSKTLTEQIGMMRSRHDPETNWPRFPKPWPMKARSALSAFFGQAAAFWMERDEFGRALDATLLSWRNANGAYRISVYNKAKRETPALLERKLETERKLASLLPEWRRIKNRALQKRVIGSLSGIARSPASSAVIGHMIYCENNAAQDFSDVRTAAAFVVQIAGGDLREDYMAKKCAAAWSTLWACCANAEGALPEELSAAWKGNEERLRRLKPEERWHFYGHLALSGIPVVPRDKLASLAIKAWFDARPDCRVWGNGEHLMFNVESAEGDKSLRWAFATVRHLRDEDSRDVLVQGVCAENLLHVRKLRSLLGSKDFVESADSISEGTFRCRFAANMALLCHARDYWKRPTPEHTELIATTDKLTHQASELQNFAGFYQAGEGKLREVVTKVAPNPAQRSALKSLRAAGARSWKVVIGEGVSGMESTVGL